MNKYKFISPLDIQVGFSKKKNKPTLFILNLNQFRNLHYRLLNIAKIKYKELLTNQIQEAIETVGKLDKLTKISLKIYKGDRRRFDVGNICSIHEKFIEDAMVELGLLPDDNNKIIPKVIYEVGEVDPDNPRVEVTIEWEDN